MTWSFGEVKLLALIKTALTFQSRVTLQYRVPLKVGSVLGKYSIPRWVLKSYAQYVSICRSIRK